MARIKSLLLDTNVWLDAYFGYRSGSRHASELIGLALKQGIILFYAFSSAKDIYYLTASNMKNQIREEKGRLTESDAAVAAEFAWSVLSRVRENATVVGGGQADLWLAEKFRSTHNDFEDDLVLAAVERSNADLLVSNDEKLLRHASCWAVDCEQALRLLKGMSNHGDNVSLGRSKRHIPELVADNRSIRP